MKPTLLLACGLLLPLCAGIARAADPAGGGLYGQRIVTDTEPKDSATYAEKLHAGKVSVKEVAEELAHWLGKGTGKAFEVSNAPAEVPASAIFLLGTNSTRAAAADVARLKDKGKEAFVVRSEGDSRLWIVGNSRMAIQHGVYFFLEQLGCRWFFPNDHWTIIPSLKSIALKIDRVEAPAYRGRDMGGTGGFGGSLVVDPERKMEARWEVKWKAQNRLGGEIRLAGHTGEAFIAAHKKELEAHPEYLAEIGGKRQSLDGPMGDITKLCGSNPGVRKLYIDWRLEVFKQAYDADPEGSASWGVSVEPADGSGQCECAQCNKIGDGSSTDKVFFLANEAAKAMAAKYPGRKVSLLAYNDHAMVPSFPLEPNILVWVTPYGFNKTGLTGDELLVAWGRKCKELGLYDYWSIPDWSNCLPDFGFRETVPAKLRFWHQNSVKSFMSESSFSAGNVGVVWYLASRLMWNPSADVDALLEDFYAKSFGAAAPPMRRMLERWANDFILVEHELALSFRDLQEARRLAQDEATRARVDDFVLYVQYLRLWHDYRVRTAGVSMAKDATEREAEQERKTKDHAAATDALLRYCWRIYDSAMVHSYRMAMLVMYRYETGDTSKQLLAKWPMSNKPEADAQAEGWKNFLATVKPVTPSDIGQFVADGVKDFKPLQFEPRAFSNKVVPLVMPPKGWKPGGEWVQSPHLACEQEGLFWAAEGVPQVEIMFQSYAVTASYITITVAAPGGDTVFKKKVEASTPWQTLAIPTKAPGLYRINIYDPKVTYSLKVPKDLPFVLKGGFLSTDLAPKVFFFVPKGLKRFVLYAEGAIPFDVFDPDGIRMEDKVNGLAATDMPAGSDGQAWSLSGFKSWVPLRGVNFPSLFAFSPEGMMVPEELAPRPGARR
jgi:hypothetical protein